MLGSFAALLHKEGNMKKGFTLLELLVVMVIVAVISAVALPSFLSMGKGAALRTTTANVYANLSLARQWAITHRTTTILRYCYETTNSVYKRSFYNIVDYPDYNVVQQDVILPLDVTFDPLGGNMANVQYTPANGNITNFILLKCILEGKVGEITFNSTGGMGSGGGMMADKTIKILDLHHSDIFRQITINWIGGIQVQ
jgi:prepilin-type N-terminal cleavage/methylation domain-containing protein